MAKRIYPTGKIVGGAYDGCFLFWLIDKSGEEYFVVSPKDVIRIGPFIRLDDNPISFRLQEDEVVRVECRDEAFLHEDLDIYTRNHGKITVRANRRASDLLKSWRKKGI